MCYFTNKGPISSQTGDSEFFSLNQCFGIIIASFAQICLLVETDSQVRDLAHWRLVFSSNI